MRIWHRCGISYIFNDLIEHGDTLKKMILLLAALCCAALGIVGSSLAEDGAPEEVLEYDSGYWTDLLASSSLGIFAETVRFTPPRTPWTLTKVQVAGWDGFDNETLPEERVIALEIRDEDLNLLYQFTDSQIPHFSDTAPALETFELPPLVVDDEFYVCFYSRGAVLVAFNATETSDRSYTYNRITGELLQAKVAIEGSDEPAPINWMIRAVGH